MTTEQPRIIITSGGTAEPIDHVRSITNRSTGRLGSLIAQRFCDAGAWVEYVHGPGAAVPDGAFLRPVQTADDLQAALRALCAQRVDAMIHGMAVSDYRVKAAFAEGGELERGAKIPSTLRELQLLLEPAPKVISELRDLVPEAVLVGFKLLDGVDQDVLLRTAMELLQKNRCDFVLANDLRDITPEGHIGYLLDKTGKYVRHSTKEEIAGAIFTAVTEAL